MRDRIIDCCVRLCNMERRNDFRLFIAPYYKSSWQPTPCNSYSYSEPLAPALDVFFHHSLSRVGRLACVFGPRIIHVCYFRLSRLSLGSPIFRRRHIHPVYRSRVTFLIVIVIGIIDNIASRIYSPLSPRPVRGIAAIHDRNSFKRLPLSSSRNPTVSTP